MTEELKVVLLIAVVAAVTVWSIVLLSPEREQRILTALETRLRELPTGSVVTVEGGRALRKVGHDQWRYTEPGGITLTTNGVAMHGVWAIYERGKEVEVWQHHAGSMSA